MDNFDLMESNEISSKAMGGTEMYMRFVYSGKVPRHLLENVQIIPSRLRDLKEDKIRVWFEHNLPNDPESARALKDPEMRSKFHKVVYLSNWHYQSFMNFCGVPYSTQSAVIEGGMLYIDSKEQNPHLPNKPDPKERVNISYHTTPHRGLELLVPVFLKLAEEDKNIHLHVHSSFKMYGWDARDQPYEPLYEVCRQHPQITYHGFTKYEDLVPKIRDEYHIFAYPNIWAETMCRAILEGMYYGLVCVHPDLAAITDTTGGLNKYMYNGTQDHNQHMGLHYHHLKQAIADVRENSADHVGSLQFNREYIQRRYGTDHVHGKWTKLLQELNDQYPTVESRAFPKKHFVYRTS
jgi:glycosyltransferase involved in cell wall biosynthesis